MKISVIIPVYNAVAWIEAAVRSVLRQEGVTLEVLAVDDGSTDGSGEFLDELARRDSRMRVFHQKNAGQGAARNRGLEQATGDYIYFMDADDELGASDALARLAQEMDQEQLDLLFFDAETRMDSGVDVAASIIRADSYIRRYDYTQVRTGRELFAAMLRRREFSVSPCLMMLRRSLVDAHHLRFPAARIFYEDNIFMTRVVWAAQRACHRPWRLYVRRVHAGSTVTSPPTVRHLRGYLACYLDVRQLLAQESWGRAMRQALTDRLVQYKLNLRRLMDAHPDLIKGNAVELSAEERQELERVRIYPWYEKIANGWRCLRDHGLRYTIKRILFGRQP